ncbi:MAG: proline--tRNA ligase, partial [Oscillospiraceae bacterium]|nr:proline--tRNA ligase [Oscillospiraceae bacterium]
AAGLRAKMDDSDQSPCWKFAKYEMKGVPLRVEIGPKDMEKNQCVIARRDNGEKYFVSLDELEAKVAELLDAVHENMFQRAKRNLEENTYPCTTVEEVKEKMSTQGGFAKTMWCGDLECELFMKENCGVTSRCIPFAQENLGDTCPICGKPAKKMIIWGVAY